MDQNALATSGNAPTSPVLDPTASNYLYLTYLTTSPQKHDCLAEYSTQRKQWSGD